MKWHSDPVERRQSARNLVTRSGTIYHLSVSREVVDGRHMHTHTHSMWAPGMGAGGRGLGSSSLRSTSIRETSLQTRFVQQQLSVVASNQAFLAQSLSRRKAWVRGYFSSRLLLVVSANLRSFISLSFLLQ